MICHTNIYVYIFRTIDSIDFWGQCMVIFPYNNHRTIATFGPSIRRSASKVKVSLEALETHGRNEREGGTGRAGRAGKPVSGFWAITRVYTILHCFVKGYGMSYYIYYVMCNNSHLIYRYSMNIEKHRPQRLQWIHVRNGTDAGNWLGCCFCWDGL